MTVQGALRTTEIGGLVFAYDDRVLRPRAWTQAQSAWARELMYQVPDGPVLELCCGAGHIGALALFGNDRSLVMVDASEAACAFALRNLHAAGLADRAEVRLGWLDEILAPEEIFPLILADPPWVPSAEVSRFPEDPLTAIDGGSDGLAVARTCLEVVGRHLDPAGRSLLQLGNRAQVDAVGAWLQQQSSLRLVVGETRAFERGVLVLLHRPEMGPRC